MLLLLARGQPRDREVAQDERDEQSDQYDSSRDIKRKKDRENEVAHDGEKPEHAPPCAGEPKPHGRYEIDHREKDDGGLITRRPHLKGDRSRPDAEERGPGGEPLGDPQKRDDPHEPDQDETPAHGPRRWIFPDSLVGQTFCKVERTAAAARYVGHQAISSSRPMGAK